jgi:hypothetical protein
MRIERILGIAVMCLALLAGCGGDGVNDIPDDGDPPEEAFEWGEPDPLHNIVSAPVLLQLEVGEDYELDHLRIFADGEQIALLNEGPYDFTWEEDAGALPGYHELTAASYDGGDALLDERDLPLLIQEEPGANYFGGGGSDAAYALAPLAGGAIAMAGDFVHADGYARGFMLVIDEAAGERWFRLYGLGEGHLRGAVATGDGGFALGGWLWSEPGRGTSRQWLLKTDDLGGLQWTSEFTIEANKDDYVQDLIPASDAGYILTGHSQTFGGGFLLKAATNGNPVWSRSLGPESFGYSVAAVSGGYAVAGLQEAPWGTIMLLVRFAADGSQTWANTYAEGGAFSVGRCVIAAHGGGFVITGGTDEQLWLLSTDDDGQVQWSRTYGGISWDLGLAVAATDDGGYIVCGQTTPPGFQEPDLWLIKTDGSGIEEWQRSFGGSGREVGYDVSPKEGGGYFIAGASEIASGGGTEAWLLETDSQGNAIGRILTPEDPGSEGGDALRQARQP